MIRSPLLVVLFLACATDGGHVQAERSVVPRPRPFDPYAPIEDQPGLPRVLLIGDSISEGYTVPVRKRLQGKANVHRIGENGGPTKNGVAKIDKWLGTDKWDVIHFNWGLHDLMFHPDKQPNPAQYERDQLAQYDQNLRTLTARLKRTGAKLIWASSTPVPEEMNSPRSPSHRSHVVKIYNETARKIMTDNDISIDDLYAHVEPVLEKTQKPHDVHFTVDGSEFLGKKVADEISRVLVTDPPSRPAESR
ncbi:MAG: SGNH/GDSL hydrolase family protein [Planctomycetes bacterium]|nr:SGNH/GDSL hydrolase family protein [Planctomycetota bacterium]